MNDERRSCENALVHPPWRDCLHVELARDVIDGCGALSSRHITRRVVRLPNATKRFLEKQTFSNHSQLLCIK